MYMDESHDISDLHAFFLHTLSPNREDEGVTAKTLLYIKVRHDACRFNCDELNKVIIHEG